MIFFLLTILLATGTTKVSKDSGFLLRHELSNLQTELGQAKARVESQESVIDALRHEMENHLSTNRELIKGTLTDSSGKISSVEKISQALASDLIELKKGVETALDRLEKEIETQGKNLRHLESALKAVLDAVGVESGTSPILAADRTYTVKDGDSLGKIALSFGTNIKSLKDHNNLTKDTIRVGQKLQIP